MTESANSSEMQRMSLESALDVLARRREDQVVVGTMTANGVWREKSPHDLNLACIGFMGGASTLALGVALSQPERDVWVIDGDGSLMMQLGSLGTIAGAAPKNFLHIVIHNGVYETSGSQPLPSQQQVDFARMADGAGYAQTASFGDAEEFDAALDELLAADGPALYEARRPLLHRASDAPRHHPRPRPHVAPSRRSVAMTLLGESKAQLPEAIMETVEEIQQAIEALSEQDYERLPISVHREAERDFRIDLPPLQ